MSSRAGRRARGRIRQQLRDGGPQVRSQNVQPRRAAPLEAPRDVGRNNPAARAYVNDRRAGITHPDEIELLERDDPRLLERAVAMMSPSFSLRRKHRRGR